MKKEKTIFLQYIGDSPRTKILDFLINGRMFDYSLTEISKKAGISWSTFKRIWPDFIKQKLVIQTRTIGNAKLFKINLENSFIQKLLELREKILEEATSKKILIPV
ncbi:MAG: hypothetical protein QXP53_02035 [Candidatus Pacearchaeota archaeon]